MVMKMGIGAPYDGPMYIAQIHRIIRSLLPIPQKARLIDQKMVQNPGIKF